MTVISSLIPTELRAGDTATWRRTLSDYPASAGWTLKYTMLPQTGAPISFSATADGDAHLINVAASVTAAWPAGIYRMQEFVTKGIERYTLSSTRLKVLLDVAAQSAGVDTRSHARKVLDALEAWLETSTPPPMKIEIAGRLLQNHPIPELLVLRDRYRIDVAREDAAACGKVLGGRVLTRFTR